MDRAQPPLANTVTLGVRDFDAQRNFYGRLGWPQAFDSDDFAVFATRISDPEGNYREIAWVLPGGRHPAAVSSFRIPRKPASRITRDSTHGQRSGRSEPRDIGYGRIAAQLRSASGPGSDAELFGMVAPGK